MNTALATNVNRKKALRRLYLARVAGGGVVEVRGMFARGPVGAAREVVKMAPAGSRVSLTMIWVAGARRPGRR